MSNAIEKRERIVDTLTGEVLLDETNIVDITRLPIEPDYIKLYISDLGSLCDLTDGQRSILLYIAARVGYDGMVTLPMGVKALIAKNAGCSISSVNNAVNFFCKNKILRKEGGGFYELNPDYFARGKWREIRERRKAFYTKITYTPEGGRVIETNAID
jgi:hypothetical protein